MWRGLVVSVPGVRCIQRGADHQDQNRPSVGPEQKQDKRYLSVPHSPLIHHQGLYDAGASQRPNYSVVLLLTVPEYAE